MTNHMLKEEIKGRKYLHQCSLNPQYFNYLSQHDSNIVTFSRLKVGEGIEVEVKDFAEEVAEQLK